jgi:hypothetical protein
MESKKDKQGMESLPETTQKKEGTTSAFSAASGTEKTQEDADKFTGEQGRASFHPGTTTQGGSNYGQGSAYLGPSSYSQGATGGSGSNYENEAGKFAETGTQADGNDADKERRQQGGTDAEHDELSGDDRVANTDSDDKEDTAGIP